jgi:hypothetical protein
VKRKFIFIEIKSLFRFSVRRICMLIMFTLFTCGVYAQRTAYLYLQSEGGNPFYLKKDNQIYSSTASGYLIVSKLPENDQLFYIGFPGGTTPEMLFRLSIGNGGRGVLIKFFGERGWGLFDFQDATITYPLPVDNAGNYKSSTKEQNPVNDPFANMLSQVTNDSTVKYVGERVEGVKTVQVEPQDTIVSTTEIEINTLAPDSIISRPTFSKSEIIRAGIETGSNGTNLVYVVSKPNSDQDTIHIFIPSEINLLEEKTIDTSILLKSDLILNDSIFNPQFENIKEEIISSAPDSTGLNESVEDISPINITDTLSVNQSDSTGYVFLSDLNAEVYGSDSTYVNSVDSVLTDSINRVENQEQKEVLLNLPVNDCKKAASENDFLKVRRKMAQQSKNEEMISEAQKFFKNMCFTTEQIRNLGALFLNDEGRYRFYDAALKYVLDFKNFITLENTLISDYYKKRFHALIPE